MKRKISKPAIANPPRSVAGESERWDVKSGLGHHRARVAVDSPATAVRVILPWRLPLADMESKGVVVIDPQGNRLLNVARPGVSNESGEFVFEAKTAGTYDFYFLPYRFRKEWGGDCESQYESAESTAKPEWLQGMADASSLPVARVVGFEARTEFDRFDPMEVVATAQEVEEFKKSNPGRALLFPEDRTRAIRMRDFLPLDWIQKGSRNVFEGKACRNEYHPFQVGLWAVGGPLQKISYEVGPLRSEAGDIIPAKSVSCLNLDGVDIQGRDFKKTLNVAAGNVQALWFGVDVARDQKPGLYKGTLTITGEGMEPTALEVSLEVLPELLEDRGDGEVWRMSRLRWINSRAGLEETVIAPYVPLKVEGKTIHCLGRSVELGPDGLPSVILAGETPVLQSPVRFFVETTQGPLDAKGGNSPLIAKGDARVDWESISNADGLEIACKGWMEFDGYIRYEITLKAEKGAEIRDIRMEIPYNAESSRYLAGIGKAGGSRGGDYDWKWAGPYDSFWMGGVRSGLWCELRGGAYHGPLLNLYRPEPPCSWSNEGKGGVFIQGRNDGATATAYSGPRLLKAGDELHFEFALLPTPVKPLDTVAHFRTRYFHACTSPEPGGENVDPPAEALSAGVNVVNLHHSSARNPYINTPFQSNEALRSLAGDMNTSGRKMKIYYTLRELSNHAPELWFLRSLGNEVIASGRGGGFAWLQEHLRTDYEPAWYSPLPGGETCAAFVNTGQSRWYNHYVEGLGWLVRNLGIDGLYLDDVSYDRHTLKRMRRVMESAKKGCLLDLHSNTAFSIGPANQYMEFTPYLDRLWFGEAFDYNQMTPDEWLVQVSGIPFGLMGDMLHRGGNQWRGPIFGMTTRLGWTTEHILCDPRNVWKVWDLFGITDSEMIGFWEKDCPVRTDNPEVKATVYRKDGSALIALASWASNPVEVKLDIDWKALGLDPAKMKLRAPASEGFQPEREFSANDPIPVEPSKGWMLLAAPQ